MKIELVYWRDAYFVRDDEGGTLPHKEYIMEAVGWVDVQGRWLTIRAEKDRQMKTYRCVTRVPLENVLERVVLTPATEAVTVIGDGGTE